MSNFSWLFLALVSAVVGAAQAIFVYLSVTHNVANNAAIGFAGVSGVVWLGISYFFARRGTRRVRAAAK